MSRKMLDEGRKRAYEDVKWHAERRRQQRVSRLFDGIRYNQASIAKTKAQADKDKALLKRAGNLVRVVKDAKEGYIVYACPKSLK